MNLWRICRAQYEASAFSGHGAEKTGGRWNPKGVPLVYTAENLSLAILELFVHVSPPDLPDDLVAICGTLPDDIQIKTIKASELPANWRNYPAPAALQIWGAEWLQSQASLAAAVPSAINPVENNILLNPAHPEIRRLQVKPANAFHFDPRMFGT